MAEKIRVVESGDRRITENGDVRVMEDHSTSGPSGGGCKAAGRSGGAVIR